jgi:toxin YoeB
LEFDLAAFEDLAWWVETDRKKALRILKLIKEIQRKPFEGTGKPEALKGRNTGGGSAE